MWSRPSALRAPGLALLLLAAAYVEPPGLAAQPAAAPSSAELQRLVDTLQDDKARAGFVAQLQALIAAQRAVEPASPVPPEPGDYLAGLSRRLDAFAEEVLAGVAAILDAPRILAWVNAQITDPTARHRWSEVLLDFAIVFGLAIFAEVVVRLVVARFGMRGGPPQRDGRIARLVFAAIGLVIEMLPVAAFAGAAMLAMAITVPPFSIGRAAISLLVQATVAARLFLALAKAVLVPDAAWQRIVPASEETRNYLLIWVQRFTCWGVFGYGIAGAAWWLGVPGAIYALLLKVVGLGLSLLAIVFILQNREPVARWIGGAETAEAGSWTRLRHHFGATWHVLAILYISAVYLVYALHNEVGSAYVLRATALSIMAIVAARLLARAIERLSERGFGIRPDLKARFPLLEHRANRYLLVVIRIAGAAVYALAVLVVLQAWDLASFAWFATGVGRRVGGGVLSIALVIVIAVVGWELLAAAIERNLAALDQAGAPARARRRTLLPLLRTTMAGVIAVIAGLTMLSQIGIDIGPLLAGAGVIGVAIGFGSQALIKDIINGLFILVEDQIAVGDIVDVGKEHAGVVEAISIRTIRLRDQAGTVHTVPFSEVTTVKNLTKEFAYAVARIGIAYGEDIDRVVEILRGVCDELADDPEIGPLILDRFDYQGVDSLSDSSVQLLLRVRTLPAKNFAVSRALNRLVKIAFATHGIAMRDPTQVMLTGPAQAGLDQPDRGEDRTIAADVTADRRRTA